MALLSERCSLSRVIVAPRDDDADYVWFGEISELPAEPDYRGALACHSSRDASLSRVRPSRPSVRRPSRRAVLSACPGAGGGGGEWRVSESCSQRVLGGCMGGGRGARLGRFLWSPGYR